MSTKRKAPASALKSGATAGIAAFGLWGILPVFWKTLGEVPATTIICHRVYWSLLVLLLLLALQRRAGETFTAFRHPRVLAVHGIAAILVTSNWLIYVWATHHEHIIEGALGYYLTPFLNVLLGRLFLGERQTRMEKIALLLAGVGVGIQLAYVGRVPWIALALAVTFSLYGLVRKQSSLGALPGLTLETALTMPFALAWLFAVSPSVGSAFGNSAANALLLVLTGIVTATPLLLFGHAARNLRLVTLGILQFIGPTGQFLIGWLIYDEPMTANRFLSFAFIWAAVALYAADAIVRQKRVPPANGD